jgi:chemotaxis protein methyltransferase CheR
MESSRPPLGHAVLPGPIEINDQEFGLFQSLIRRESGIHLPDPKKTMLVSRLVRRLHALNLTSFTDYYRHVVYGGEGEMARLLDAICTNETWFFRNGKHFDFLRDELAGRWIQEQRAGRRAPRVRIWSAGCSTGEEPFSIAMVLLDTLPSWGVSVTATDLSTRALERAEAATWPLEKSKDIPASSLKRYMLRGTGSQDGKMKAGLDLRTTVSFRRLNLNDAMWPFESSAPFDAVFCRNVLMYFEPACRERIVRRLLACLAPNGHVFVGDAEGLNGFAELRLAIPGVYTFRNKPEHGQPVRDGVAPPAAGQR